MNAAPLATVETVWRCACHPRARWGFFANYPECPISDLFYADPASTTYGTRYTSLDGLLAVHPTANSGEGGRCRCGDELIVVDGVPAPKPAPPGIPPDFED